MVPIEIPLECEARIALQRGVIGRRQALGSGLAADSIETMLRTGRWRRLHRGVYATFTGEPSRESLLWAALVRAGPDAMLSHQTAAELFGLTREGDPDGPIHVTVPREGSHPRGIDGVVVHRAGRAAQARHPYFLPPRTSVEVTVVDLAASARSSDEASSWLYRATGTWLTGPDRLREAIRQRPAMRWRAELLSSLTTGGDGVRSALELRYVRDVERAHALPEATRQAQVVRSGRTRYLDNLYEAYRVCVELDGLAAHPPGERWRDLHRDNAGAVEGILTLRYGWPDVTERPCEVAEQVVAVLRQRGWNGIPRPCRPSCRLR